MGHWSLVVHEATQPDDALYPFPFQVAVIDAGHPAGLYKTCYSYSGTGYQDVKGSIKILNADGTDPVLSGAASDAEAETTRNFIIIIGGVAAVVIIILLILLWLWLRRQGRERERLEIERKAELNLNIMPRVATPDSQGNPLDRPHRDVLDEAMVERMGGDRSALPHEAPRPTSIRTTVHVGEEIVKKDHIGEITPYVKMGMAGMSARTSAVRSAHWEETVEHPIPRSGDYTLLELRVEVYDQEGKQEDDLIGSAMVAPFALLSGASRADSWVTTFDEDGQANGRIHVEFEPVMPAGQVAVAMPRVKTPPELPPSPGQVQGDENALMWRDLAMQQAGPPQGFAFQTPVKPYGGPDYMPVLPLDVNAPRYLPTPSPNPPDPPPQKAPIRR